MNDRVRVEIKDHVAHVQLCRPEKMNALTGATISALIAAGEQVKQDRTVRAVVLSGEGKAFCAGIDLSLLAGGSDHNVDDMGIRTRDHGIANAVQQAVLQWRQLPVPVIAAVHGVALGGGFQLMLGADIRVIHPTTKLGLIEVKWGMVPDMTGIYLMRELVRPDVLADIVYSARTFSGTEAKEMGIATRISNDPLATAFEIANEIATKSPDAVRAAKRLLTMADQAQIEQILVQESTEQLALLGSPNQTEAVRAGMKKHAANFTDYPRGLFFYRRTAIAARYAAGVFAG